MLRSFRFRQPVDASPASLLGRLRDLDRLSRWAPGVERSRLLAREGHVSVCELAFRDVARTLTLEVVYGDRQLRFTEVDRLAGHGLAGELTLRPGDGDATEVDLRCRFPRWILWPPARRRLREALLQAVGALARGTAAGDVLVELVTTEPELRLRIRGRDYRLVPEP